MIYWATNYDRIGGYDDLPAVECGICSKKNKVIYSVEQGYFTLYGMALCPTKKQYYKTCPDCSARLKVRKSDSNLNSVREAVPGRLKFKYIWGWLILAPIFVLLALLIQFIIDSRLN
jgi:hypothetical protein